MCGTEEIMEEVIERTRNKEVAKPVGVIINEVQLDNRGIALEDIIDDVCQELVKGIRVGKRDSQEGK